jgi:ATP-dependent DNA helicase PIF1
VRFCNPHADCHKVVVTGDFFQLPPVTQGGKDVFFAFQSDAWKESIEHTVTLTQVFHQKDSGKFLAQRALSF